MEIYPGGLQPGKMCRIQGVTHPNADRFNINLQTGPNAKPRDDTALHISVRLNQGYVARNTYKGGEWGDEQGRGSLPIGTAQSFEILILVEPSSYKIAINGQHFCDFSHIIPYGDVTHLLIDGDVSITVISWEASAPVLAETLSQASQLNAQQQQGVGPQEAYGPPPGGYAPQGQFGPQGGYGPPPPGYGPPPPPGAEPQSGLDSFLEQAQSVLAGAIKSGAAEKLLGGLLSSGGNQQPPQGQAIRTVPASTPAAASAGAEGTDRKSPLRLSIGRGWFRNPSSSNSPTCPKSGAMAPSEGWEVWGGLLTNFAGQLLHKPRDN
ncbi:hypothetical protein NQ318_013268 [Aromia moschata]|uniref:Galectin n=1 Tax=Aromia moschata TaxID=1265417 RepID=A0AAV8XST5_9CUCU|nr:hypothetical protein NQ318_013268 [Aromia moschata]